MDAGLENRTVLVTGASGGIGTEIVRALGLEDAKIVVQFRSNAESAHALVAEVGEERSLAIAADLTSEASVANLFEKSKQRFGGVDHLICNAGVWPPENVPLAEMTVQQWNDTLSIDLTSVFLCCRAFLQSIRSRSLEDPSIVLIGSTAGVFGEAGHGDYASAKSAMICGLMNTLKNEIVSIAPRGRVNSVSPGWVLTPMTEKFSDDGVAMKRALATIAMNKVATPQDIANAVTFFSSPKLAGHITGQNLIVSGGMEGRMLHVK